MTNHRSNTTGDTCGARTTHLWSLNCFNINDIRMIDELTAYLQSLLKKLF